MAAVVVARRVRGSRRGTGLSVPNGNMWYVLVEETGVGGIGEGYGVTEVEHVDGGVERARETALEIAKRYPGNTRYVAYERSVFRLDENSLMVVLRHDWRKESFRVTVAELIHMQEASG